MIAVPTAVRLTVLSAALALAACGGREAATADSAAAAASPDSSGLQTTPPQPNGPMNMVDSASRAPAVADSPSTALPGDTTRTPGTDP